LNAFNLKTCSKIFIDERKVQHSLFKDSTEFKFYERYALSANNIVFNPINLEIKDAFIGTIESYSKNLDKIVSHRTNTIYLSVYNTQSQKYELSEIQLDDYKYKESYLSPNGQFLVLQDENNKYVWYDIEKNETVKFISGNFLAFRNDGSLVVEQDNTRAVKIIDPKTFQDITPPNYHHYRFMSPDGKLYAQVSSKVRYFNKLNGKEITLTEVSKYRQDLDEPSFHLQEKEKEQAKLKVEKNRQQIFSTFKKQFEELGVEDHSKINSQFVIKVDKFVEIGIVGTNKTIEVQLPADTNFYNYASFSFDNQYLGIVGKPTFGSINRSLILICSISFDEKSNSLEINNNMISRFPRYAAWVCGFSKSGYFATYDSSPDTFLINIGNDFFADETNDLELRQNINNSRNNIYNSYKRWNVIKGKNFLCFSSTGVFLALSEQGYEPLTKGGYGHQESNVVHIAKTNSGEIIDSFTGHGDKIKDNKTKKVTFVAFSEDEKRIMTLSSDGVVIIRDLNILESVEVKQEEEMPAANILYK
jgi:WD40 repeat protein